MTREYIRKIDSIPDPKDKFEEYLNNRRVFKVIARTLTYKEAKKIECLVVWHPSENDGYLVTYSRISRVWIPKSSFDKVYEMQPTLFEEYKERIESLYKRVFELRELARSKEFYCMSKEKQSLVIKEENNIWCAIETIHSCLKSYKDDYDELIRSGWDWSKC